MQRFSTRLYFEHRNQSRVYVIYAQDKVRARKLVEQKMESPDDRIIFVAFIADVPNATDESIFEVDAF